MQTQPPTVDWGMGGFGAPSSCALSTRPTIPNRPREQPWSTARPPAPLALAPQPRKQQELRDKTPIQSGTVSAHSTMGAQCSSNLTL